ncbi:glutathione S-transferase C-terminal domain-containing protein [Leptolyngbya sp. DQ-M1]
MPPLLLKLIFDRIEQQSMPFFIKPVARLITSRTKQAFIEPQLMRHLDYLEAELGKSLWFAGDDFTGADVQMSFSIEAAVARAGLDRSRPKLIEFCVAFGTA